MNKMLRAILPIIMTLVLLITGCQPLSEPPGGTSPTAPEGTQVGNLAPDFQLKNLDGQTVSLSDLRGKPVLINFWASWCRPCVFEMPYLQQIYEARSGEGLVLLAINIGESPSKAESFVQNHDLSLPVILDINRVVAQKYNITAIPTTFFIDKNGIIKEKTVGAFPNVGAIEKHLGKIIP